VRKRRTPLTVLCLGISGRRRPFTAEAPPIGKIHPFSKIIVTFEPVIWMPFRIFNLL
jgi:hypothetical protein